MRMYKTSVITSSILFPASCTDAEGLCDFTQKLAIAASSISRILWYLSSTRMAKRTMNCMYDSRRNLSQQEKARAHAFEQLNKTAEWISHMLHTISR
jgi:hypothetical protein